MKSILKTVLIASQPAIFLHGSSTAPWLFLRILLSTNGIKSCKASHLYLDKVFSNHGNAWLYFISLQKPYYEKISFLSTEKKLTKLFYGNVWTYILWCKTHSMELLSTMTYQTCCPFHPFHCHDQICDWINLPYLNNKKRLPNKSPITRYTNAVILSRVNRNFHSLSID